MRKILVLGHARHGKDTVAEMICRMLNLTYRGSSELLAEEVVFPLMKDRYETWQACFADRVNHREEWFNIVGNYCKLNKAAIADLVYERNDIYCGVRAIGELEAIIAKYDPIVIWVDASPRVIEEPVESMQIRTARPGWHILRNVGKVETLLKDVANLVAKVMPQAEHASKWDRRFFDLARTASTWSKDPKAKVGACIVSPDRRMITLGYNGYIAGMDYADDKNTMTVHAELNAILNARRDLTGWTLYVTKPPCVDCAKAIVQAGIREVITKSPKNKSKWLTSNLAAFSLFKTAQIEAYFIHNKTKISIEAFYEG